MTLELNDNSSVLLNAIANLESGIVTGTSTDINSGVIINVSLNNQIYTCSIENNTFSCGIPAMDLSNLSDSTTYELLAYVTINGTDLSSSEQITTGVFNLGISKTHAVNVETTTDLRFVSDVEMDTIRGRILELEHTTYKSDTIPTEGVDEGDTWYDSAEDIFYVYREYPKGSGQLRWEPLLFKWDDDIDGGAF